ncbi:DUF924 family protein [Bdellovibrio svalbardensis]|uniref:DUF924 domain-containing protein n=1 Tax=Bdellovibrio svalbardensis TaxID=2972972 RepID=A0ABT6DHN5_9BACT|nr:DUF924 family protein [Bdellovibrio svalbardensis]MDG0815987.1 DUF924 domain-containing protein [Bdellovibrio svalbardensis]
MEINSQDILNFWFEEIDSRLWFAKDHNFDDLIRERFTDIHNKAVLCETYDWRKTPEGRLAEIIVLDQFSRNMYRDDSRAFENDRLALALAQEAVQSGDDQHLSPISKAFMYMPYMHSESQKIHEEAVRLFSQPGLEGSLEYELLHKEIIDRFGRYPYRNEFLGRPSTREELEFLKLPGSTF